MCSLENGAGLVMGPLGTYPVTTSEVEKSVSLTVRSIGELPIAVEGISLYWRLNGDPAVESKLMGRDDYVGKNHVYPSGSRVASQQRGCSRSRRLRGFTRSSSRWDTTSLIFAST